MAMQPVLDLNTLIERPKIRIDGVPYELFSIDELSILDSQRLAGWGKEIEALAKAEDDGGDQATSARLAELVAKVARNAIVEMPESVFARLTEAQHMAIAQVFTGLLLARKMATVGALVKGMLAEGKSTGEKSSRGSSASSAETRAGGSRKRRSGS